MSYHNADTGHLGEKIAAEYLLHKGFTMLHRNWRHRHWEVDIIASYEDVLHFIEVKTRRNAKFGLPEESVGRRKMKSLAEASEEFQYRYPQWKRIQFDILSIHLAQDRPPEIFFIEDISVT